MVDKGVYYLGNPPCKVFCGAGFFVIFVGVICNFMGIGFSGFNAFDVYKG